MQENAIHCSLLGLIMLKNGFPAPYFQTEVAGFQTSDGGHLFCHKETAIVYHLL